MQVRKSVPKKDPSLKRSYSCDLSTDRKVSANHLSQHSDKRRNITKVVPLGECLDGKLVRGNRKPDHTSTQRCSESDFRRDVQPISCSTVEEPLIQRCSGDYSKAVTSLRSSVVSHTPDVSHGVPVGNVTVSTQVVSTVDQYMDGSLSSVDPSSPSNDQNLDFGHSSRDHKAENYLSCSIAKQSIAKRQSFCNKVEKPVINAVNVQSPDQRHGPLVNKQYDPSDSQYLDSGHSSIEIGRSNHNMISSKSICVHVDQPHAVRPGKLDVNGAKDCSRLIQPRAVRPGRLESNRAILTTRDGQNHAVKSGKTDAHGVKVRDGQPRAVRPGSLDVHDIIDHLCADQSHAVRSGAPGVNKMIAPVGSNSIPNKRRDPQFEGVTQVARFKEIVVGTKSPDVRSEIPHNDFVSQPPCSRVVHTVKDPDENLDLEVCDDDDEPVGIGDVPIYHVKDYDVTNAKPKGSAFITVVINVKDRNVKSIADIIVDTGADVTLCTTAYLISLFGEDILNSVYKIEKLPKLRSASGHKLKVLGVINLELHLGEYVLDLIVLVQDHTNKVFLLGSDSFYNRLIYDRGRYIAFADNRYPPIPISYNIEGTSVKTVDEFIVAPNSNALVMVKITDYPQLVGKEIILYPANGEDEQFVCNTVSTIDPDGYAHLMISNATEDIVTILKNSEIARINLLSVETFDIEKLNDDSAVQYKWPLSALKGDLAKRLIPNIHIRWENVEHFSEQKEQNFCHQLRELDDSCTNHFEDNNYLNNDSLDIRYVHDKLERKQLVEGTGEGFPTPPAPEPLPELEVSVDDPEYWLSKVEHSHLSDEKWQKLKTVLFQYENAFSKSKTDIGCCRYFKADLPLKPGTGYLYNKPRPLPFKHREIAAETISDLLEQGIIRPSKSPHATNIVVVKKKTMNGVVSHRVCCDLRQVNEHSVPNRFPNFQLEDAMSKIQGSALRTAVDFRNAFHQILLNEESIPVTAFYFNNVLYEYVRVPFGHVCAMNLFCCVMALLCEGYPEACYYADDLMVLTKQDHLLTKDQIFEQHLQHVGGMLQRIIDAGLKLVAHKCQWCYGSDKPMEWLGFTIENNLLKPQESKVEAIKNFPEPKTPKQAISFVSLASFYRRFIKSFAQIAKPIYEVAHKDPFRWTSEAIKAFNDLKDAMCSDNVLRLPRQGEPFHMYSDASYGALGVVLCQLDPVDKKLHPCAYGSRKFNDTELKLSTPCKELLAIVYGLNLWSFYICGNPVFIYSDCRAWTFLKMQTGVSGKISRLALLVSEYDITVSFVQGVKNKAADGLSRAFDTGEVPFDDQATARHPALEALQAPELYDGQVMKLHDYLDICSSYLEANWPKILADYEAKQIELKKDLKSEKEIRSTRPIVKRDKNLTEIRNVFEAKTIRRKDCFREFDKETEVGRHSLYDQLGVISDDEAHYVCRIVEDSKMLHIDRLTHKLNHDYDELGSLISKDSTFSFNSETSSSSNFEGSEPLTTDSSFRKAALNIRLLVINDSTFTLEAFREAQDEDEFCSKQIKGICEKDLNVTSKGYFLKRKILLRQLKTRDGQEFDVVCVPRSLVDVLLDSTHGNLLAGHHGSQRYYLNMTRRYFWPQMKQDIEHFHKRCIPCQKNDKYPVRFTSGHVLRPCWPKHIVHCDLVVGLPKALDKSYAILLLYDGFTRFTFGIPLASEKADYIVKKFMSHFVASFGLPWALHSDNGKNIDGSLIRHLCKMLGIIKTSTPPHTPNANPCETACAAVSMLLRKALNNSDKRYWPLCLPFVLNALNSTVHTATGYTPNSLFLGTYKERPLVPLIPFESETANVNEYYQKMRRFQEISFQIARVRHEQRIESKRKEWNKNAITPKFKEGDFVLKKNNNPASGPGKMKLRAKYLGPYRIIKVYESSLILVPWDEVNAYEKYLKKPDVLRLQNRGDVRPFHTIMASMKHCKPYVGKVEKHEDVIDPIILHQFLEALDVNSNDEIVSIVDSEDSDLSRNEFDPQYLDGASNSSRSSLSVHGPDNVHPEGDDLLQHFDPADRNLADILQELNMDQDVIDLLVNQPNGMVDIMQNGNLNQYNLNELAQLVQHHDNAIRLQAENDLALVVDHLLNGPPLLPPIDHDANLGIDNDQDDQGNQNDDNQGNQNDNQGNQDNDNQNDQANDNEDQDDQGNYFDQGDQGYDQANEGDDANDEGANQDENLDDEDQNDDNNFNQNDQNHSDHENQDNESNPDHEDSIHSDHSNQDDDRNDQHSDTLIDDSDKESVARGPPVNETEFHSAMGSDEYEEDEEDVVTSTPFHPRQRVHEWLDDNESPIHGSNRGTRASPTKTFTRTGRQSKPPVRFDPSQYWRDEEDEAKMRKGKRESNKSFQAEAERASRTNTGKTRSAHRQSNVDEEARPGPSRVSSKGKTSARSTTRAKSSMKK